MSQSNTSTSLHPDLDWSQLKETILMLNLSVAQIDQSMKEGNASVETLANSFTVLANNLSSIQSRIDDIDAADNTKQEIQDSASTALSQVQSAIVAFQFYDKLTQRIDHVSDSLCSLTKLIADPSALYSPPKWYELQETIRSKYTMEEERAMFDKVLSGISIEQAINEFNAEMIKKNEHSDDDDIEFF